MHGKSRTFQGKIAGTPPLAALLCLLACTERPAPIALPTAAKHMPARGSAFLVHEWGTFTSVQDSRGHLLAGMHHDDAPLPPFVRFQGYRVAGRRPDDESQEPNQRMETPVIYLHSPAVQDVTVRVAFPNGLLTQWYPDVAELLPAESHVRAIGGGLAEWRTHVDPLLDHNLAPQVAADNIWAPSRHVEVATLRTTAARQGVSGAQAGEVEKFLFYRGVGRFELPVQVTGESGGVLHVANRAPEPVAAAILLRIEPDGRGGFTVLGGLPSRSTVTVQLPLADQQTSDWLQGARQAVRAALETAGLYPDEALAMVDTWNHAYFQTPGLRLLWVLPQPWTDAILPLTVLPRPAARVRVLVGRIDLLTPEKEAELLADLQNRFASVPAAPDADGRDRGREKAMALVQAWQPHAEAKLWATCARLADNVQRTWCELAREVAHAAP